MKFNTGPYGEIFPPPLVSGLSPDEALGRLLQGAEKAGKPISSVPSRGESRRGMYNLAMLYVHQTNLARAIAGIIPDPEAEALRRAVIEEGQALSLRPLGMEKLWFTTFAPVARMTSPS